MRTLIFNGSPRPKGDTASLLRLLTPRLTGEVTVLDAYGSQISPCIDCRHCWTAADCVLQDGMQTVYDELQRCDNVLIASPLHYAQLTAPLLGIGSRLQIYFCAGKFRGERLSKSLIDAALDYAQRLGYKKVYLKSEHHGLYEKYGFKKIADFEPTVGLANQLFEIKISI